MLELLNQFIPNIMDKLPDFWTAILKPSSCWESSSDFLVDRHPVRCHGRNQKEGILENAILYFLIGKVIDFFRTIPFIVLIF